jgi:hypothetical protein
MALFMTVTPSVGLVVAGIGVSPERKITPGAKVITLGSDLG